MTFPTSFLTPRLSATRLRAEDRDAIHAMHQNVGQMASLGGIRNDEQTDDYMQKNLAHWEQHAFGIWLLKSRENNAVAGRALLRHLLIDQVDEVEVGYGFDPEYWGCGLATEIARECLRYGKDYLKLKSVVALTRPENVPSQRVMEKIGMQFERRIDHVEGTHVIFRTNWDDEDRDQRSEIGDQRTRLPEQSEGSQYQSEIEAPHFVQGIRL